MAPITRYCIVDCYFFSLEVTADVHVYQATSQQVWYGVLCLTALLKALLNSFSYWATFSIIWMIISPMGKALLYFNQKSFSVLKIIIKNNFKAFPSCFRLNCEYFIFFASSFHVRHDCRHRKNGQSDTERMPHNNDPSDYCSFGHGICPGT